MERNNQKSLASCHARYLGQATPQKSIQYPDIIYEPVAAIYSSSKIKRQELLDKTSTRVDIHVINSGIAVEEHTSKHDTHWYPIQNLYCSAGVKPDRSKDGKIFFKELKDKVKSTEHVLFAMVVRQPDIDGRKILVCHAFLLDGVQEAQRLVNSTRYAYKNKAGWGNPVTDKEFLNAKLSYTLQHLEESEDINLAQLRIKTEEREQQLAQKPAIEASQRSTRSPKESRRTKVRNLSAPSSRSMIVRSRTAEPRRLMVTSGAPADIERSATLSSSRISTQRAHSYYQGFTTDTLNGEYGVLGTQSEVGFPQSARPSSFIPPSSLQPSPIMRRLPNGFTQATEPARRYTRNSVTPRGHRIIASSEPQELPNNFSNGVSSAVMNWDMTFNHAEMNGDVKSDTSSKKGHQLVMNGDVKPMASSKKGKQSKHHRPSKKTMEKYLHQNGDVYESINSKHIADRPLSGHSGESDSSYSITRIDNQPSTSGMNGFIENHEHADQEL